MAKSGLDHLYSKSARCAVPSAIREISKRGGDSHLITDSVGGLTVRARSAKGKGE